MNLSFARYQLPLLVWLALIFVLSAIPNMPTVKFVISSDKIAHAGIYFILCMLSRRAFFHQDRWTWVRDHALLSSVLFTIVYGILDEVHQVYVPGRTAEAYDAVADAMGALLFVAWSWFISSRRERV